LRVILVTALTPVALTIADPIHGGAGLQAISRRFTSLNGVYGEAWLR